MKKNYRNLARSKRIDVKTWYPWAGNLPLKHVPHDERHRLRLRLAPWVRCLRHAMSLQDESYKHKVFGIEGGRCWEVAQALVCTAKDPGVKLIEGVWNRAWQVEEGHLPVPHTWATVDGFRVDLIAEFYSWRCDDDEWIYQPYAEYTYEQVGRIFGDGPEDDGIFPEGFDITSYLWEQQNWESLPEPLTCDIPFTKLPNGEYGSPEERSAFHRQLEERGQYVWNIVYKSAIERLVEAHKAAQEVEV